MNTDQIVKEIRSNNDIVNLSKNEITYGKIETFSTSMPIVHKVNKYAEQYSELHNLVDNLFYEQGKNTRDFSHEMNFRI